VDKEQQLILDTYTAKPKHFTQILSRNSEIIQYVNQKTNGTNITTFLEKLYYSVYGESNICANNNRMTLRSFNQGYVGCGRAKFCKCVRDSVSVAVATAKGKYTAAEKEVTNSRRVITTKRVYGVTNNGQTTIAKTKHAEFYKDRYQVALLVLQIRGTKFKNHGDANFNNRPKAADTCLERYGVVPNPWSLSVDKQNPMLAHLRHRPRLAELFPKLSVDEIAEYIGCHTQTVYHYLAKHGFRDPYRSTFEKEIVSYLNEIGITNILTNKRRIIGKGLDIFLPDHMIAIEYNGIFYHHDQLSHIDKLYHYTKFARCERMGIQLISIFSDSWEKKKQVWKDKIKSLLCKPERKVFSRKTRIVSLSSEETRSILDANHVQGHCYAPICYGLEYSGEILAVMTFSPPRGRQTKSYSTNEYELVRYVTSCSVPGGASKLLSHFIKTHAPNKIYSYSCNSYSSGKLYSVLGFELQTENKAAYWYYHPTTKRSYHRSNFQKKKLVAAGYDPLASECDIMYKRGFLRLWNCGTRTWIMNIQPQPQNIT